MSHDIREDCFRRVSASSPPPPLIPHEIHSRCTRFLEQETLHNLGKINLMDLLGFRDGYH